MSRQTAKVPAMAALLVGPSIVIAADVPSTLAEMGDPALVTAPYPARPGMPGRLSMRFERDYELTHYEPIDRVTVEMEASFVLSLDGRPMPSFGALVDAHLAGEDLSNLIGFGEGLSTIYPGTQSEKPGLGEHEYFICNAHEPFERRAEYEIKGYHDGSGAALTFTASGAGSFAPRCEAGDRETGVVLPFSNTYEVSDYLTLSLVTADDSATDAPLIPIPFSGSATPFSKQYVSTIQTGEITLTTACAQEFVQPLSVVHKGGITLRPVNHSRGKIELTVLAGVDPALGIVNGLTERRARDPGIRYQPGEMPTLLGQGVCIVTNPEEWSISLRPDINLSVAREHAEGGCAYRAVLAHEQHHAARHEQIAEEYAKRIARRLEAARLPVPGAAWWFADAEEGYAKLDAYVKATVGDILRDYDVTATAYSRSLDNAAEYALVRALCSESDWGR